MVWLAADCPCAADSELFCPYVRGLCSDATVWWGLGLVGVVNTRRLAVQRPRDDCTIDAMMVPRRAPRCGLPSGALHAAVAVVEPYMPRP